MIVVIQSLENVQAGKDREHHRRAHDPLLIAEEAQVVPTEEKRQKRQNTADKDDESFDGGSLTHRYTPSDKNDLRTGQDRSTRNSNIQIKSCQARNIKGWIIF